MSKDTVLIITGEDRATGGSGRPLEARGGTTPGLHLHERGVAEVRENITRFLKNLREILTVDEEVKGAYSVNRVEVDAQITGEGKVGFLGTGVTLGASTGIKIILQRNAD